MKPNSAKKATVMDSAAAVKRRSANSRRSSIGCAVRRSCQTNAANSATAPAMPSSERTDPQPCPGASMIVYTSAPRPSADSSRPVTSMRGASGVAALGHEQQHQRDGDQRDRQLDQEGAAPPELLEQRAAGDRAERDRQPVLAPHSPIALARAARSRNTCVRIDRVVGKTAGRADPVKARAR
jgi:hypothetical protein